MNFPDPSPPAVARGRLPILPAVLLVATGAWLNFTGRHGWNGEVLEGFQQGLKTARESSRYQPDPLPEPVEEASGSFVARLPEDIAGSSVSDLGIVLCPQKTVECGVLVIPFSWPAAAPLTAALEKMGQRAANAFKLGGGEFSLGTPRDRGPEAFARGSGKISGEKLTTETWIVRREPDCLFFLAFAPKADWDKRRHALVSMAASFERRRPPALAIEERAGFGVPVPAGWDLRHGDDWVEISGKEGAAALRLERIPPRAPEVKASGNLVGELSGMIQSRASLGGFRLEQARSLPDPAGEPQGGPAAVVEGTLPVDGVTTRAVVTLVGSRQRGGERLLVLRRCHEEVMPELGHLLVIMERGARLERPGVALRVTRPQPWGGHALLEDWRPVRAAAGEPWARRLTRELARAPDVGLEPLETLCAWVEARGRVDGRAWLVNAARRRPDGQLLDGNGARLDPVPAGGPP